MSSCARPNRSPRSRRPVITTAVLGAVVLAGCSAAADSGDAITVTGSATVAPVTSTMAQQVNVAIDQSVDGTLDGFEEFCSGRSAINNASIPIPGADAETDFQQMCADNSVEFLELPIGYDAISMVRNVANGEVTNFSLEQVEAMWAPGSEVTNWSDLDDAWPDEPIGLYGRPDGSGTLDHFTEQVMGEAGAIRADYAGSDEIEELSEWIAEDPYGLGFMGVGNYLATDGEIRVNLANVNIDGVAPTREATQNGDYPLARPLFIYASVDALEDEHVESFVTEYVNEAEALMPRVFYYALPSESYDLVSQRVANRTTGTMYAEEGRTAPAGDQTDVSELLRTS